MDEDRKEPGGPMRVTVAIAVYNQAHFLADALDSVMAQTRPVDEIIVVDDGSHDHPETVADRYPEVRLIRQDNAGLSAARNTGLLEATGDLILFLDADDMLRPEAIATALTFYAANPDAAFVYGGHRRVDSDGAPIGEDKFYPTGDDAHADLLRGNLIGMHATVVYDAETLRQAGGFHPDLRKCEDYDVYLRLTRNHSIAHHPDIVADYRIHGSNMSGDSREMLRWVERVHERHKPRLGDPPAWHEAWREGKRIWREYYAAEIARLSQGGAVTRVGSLMSAASLAPRQTGNSVVRALRRRVAAKMPAEMKYRLKRLAGKSAVPPVGKVDLGDLDRTTPIDPDFGFGRGLPVDRHYIDHFLNSARDTITGRVLEIGDAAYSRTYGSGITQQDVLHVDIDAPEATIAGDLSADGVLPSEAFDCMIITQTLHLIYDMKAAIRQMHAALKPGGTLLLTVPGITSIDRGEWGDTWYWSLTRQSAEKLFAECFDPGTVEIAAVGNVYAATCFIQGLALEEVDRAKLEPVDRSFPVIVTVRATKADRA